MNLIATLDTSAQAYCTYEATNAANASCVAQAHTEVTGCAGFTGADVQTREVAAGYPQSLAYTEVATSYGNNPTAAVPGWIDTVFHRIPLLDPWTVDMGYADRHGRRLPLRRADQRAQELVWARGTRSAGSVRRLSELLSRKHLRAGPQRDGPRADQGRR
jgi:hypothetical protein